MTEGPVIWTITDEDAKTADDAQHREDMAQVEDAWLRETDLLATAYGALLTKLPLRLAHDIIVVYAQSMFRRQEVGACADCAGDDGSDWIERQE